MLAKTLCSSGVMVENTLLEEHMHCQRIYTFRAHEARGYYCPSEKILQIYFKVI
jgi:hypothetical protein